MKIEAFGKLYTGGDARIAIFGQNADGVDGVKYGINQEKQDVYQMGSREPMGRLHKNITYTGSITVKAVLLDSLEKASKGKGIVGIAPFEVAVSYMDENDAVIKHDVLKYCEFTGVTREVKNDNNELVYELPLVIGGIDSNQ